MIFSGPYHHGDLESELDDALFKNRDMQKQNASLKSKVRIHTVKYMSTSQVLSRAEFRSVITCFRMVGFQFYFYLLKTLSGGVFSSKLLLILAFSPTYSPWFFAENGLEIDL